MGSHPLNLALRFLLELIALLAIGMWGWNKNDGWLRFVFAIGLPIILGAIWATFAVPDDPSRSGNTLVVTPGLVRLMIELGIFGIATWCFYSLGLRRVCYAFGLIVLIHYLLSYDRVAWLISQ